MSRWVFRGHIAGVGTSEGTRLVLGRWRQSPLGALADVMVERPDLGGLLRAIPPRLVPRRSGPG